MTKKGELFERLTPEAQELVPVSHRLMSSPPQKSLVERRMAESRWYRASGFECFAFHRPISKCFGMVEKSEKGDREA